MLKGDALVTYLKEPSVPLACNILDGDSLRPGGPAMSVSEARFEMKGEQYQAKSSSKGKGGGKGGGSRKQQLEKLEKKLGWGGFDDKLPPEKVREGGWVGEEGFFNGRGTGGRRGGERG